MVQALGDVAEALEVVGAGPAINWLNFQVKVIADLLVKQHKQAEERR